MVLDTDRVFSVFKLFYNSDDAEEFIPVALLAAEYTSARILGDENFADPRLYYLAAAEVLCRVLEIKAAREHLVMTAGGVVTREEEYSVRLDYARGLYKGYEALCVGLIRDDGFLFLRTGQ